MLQEAKAAAAKQAAEAAVAELRAEAATLRAEAAASADARRDAEAARGALAAAEARAQALEVQLSPLGATAGPPASPPAVLLATEQVPSAASDYASLTSFTELSSFCRHVCNQERKLLSETASILLKNIDVKNLNFGHTPGPEYLLLPALVSDRVVRVAAYLRSWSSAHSVAPHTHPFCERCRQMRATCRRPVRTTAGRSGPSPA